MTVEEISKFAASGKNIAGMSCPERCLFLSLKEIYRDFKEGKITREDGEARKRRAVEQYEVDLQENVKSRDIYLWHTEFWRNIEEASGNYARNPSIESADAFFKAVYGAGRKKFGGEQNGQSG